MMTSIFIAKVVGLWILIVGIALVKNSDAFKKMTDEYMQSPTSLFLGAILALIFGAFIVAGHNIWEFNWPVIVTIFGWLSLIKGACILIFPEEFKKFAAWYIQKVNLRLAGIVYLILGAFLCMKGFL